jgi:hypothetical protein
MSYEELTTTKIVATHCCSCGRPLLDASSVTTGMGPTCRKKYSFPETLTEEQRVFANSLVHKLGVLRQEDNKTNDKLADIKATLKEIESIEGCEDVALKFRFALISPLVEVAQVDKWTYAVTFGDSSKIHSDRARSAKWRFIGAVKEGKLGYNKKVDISKDASTHHPENDHKGPLEWWELRFNAKNKRAIFELMKEEISGAPGRTETWSVGADFIIP